VDRDETVEPIPNVISEPVSEIAEPVASPTATRPRRPDPEPDRGPFFSAIWQGRPIYRCPLCQVAKTDREGLSGDAAIRTHIGQHHATAQPLPEERAAAAGLVIRKR
jgi:hypothetical protein